MPIIRSSFNHSFFYITMHLILIKHSLRPSVSWFTAAPESGFPAIFFSRQVFRNYPSPQVDILDNFSYWFYYIFMILRKRNSIMCFLPLHTSVFFFASGAKRESTVCIEFESETFYIYFYICRNRNRNGTSHNEKCRIHVLKNKRNKNNDYGKMKKMKENIIGRWMN